MRPHSCPLCGHASTRDRGKILHYTPHKIAGIEIDLSGMSFHLRACAKCNFNFKDPPITEAKLLECYARADEANWEINPDPHMRYFEVFKRVAEQHAPGRRALDIGCFNGALLQYLGSEWKTFGVEPSERAAKLAGERGVTILGATLQDIPKDHPPFDAIFAIDVLEHIIDPMPFCRRVRELLAPNGVFIGLTGDTGALCWRAHGSLYWYCSFPEHVSFFSRQTMDYIGDNVGMTSIAHQHMSHHRTSLGCKADQWAKSLFFITGTKLGWLGVSSLRKRFHRCGPMWFASRDHMLHVMRVLTPGTPGEDLGEVDAEDRTILDIRNHR